MTPHTQHRHAPPSAPSAHGGPQRTVGLVWEWEDDPDQRIGVTRYASGVHWILRRHIFVRRIETDGTIAHVLSGTVPDGIITQLSSYAPELQTVRELAARGVPVVELSAEVPDLDVPRVLPDRYAEGGLAAQHFLERGIRTLIYLGNPNRPYHAGFADEATKCGVPVIVPQIPPASSAPRHRMASARPTDKRAAPYGGIIEELLSAHRPPIGVFVPFAELCEGVLDECLERNLLVPEQVALISIGGSHGEFECLSVPITTVVTDVEKRAVTAAALLDRMMRGDRDVPAVTLIPPCGIVARASTRITGVADPDIARAWNHILTHVYDANLSLKGVARAAGIPLWRLYEEFPKHASMTVARYIQRQRILHARHLLETTHLTASEIATQCGFSELRQFRDALRRTMGTTPAAWRAHHCGVVAGRQSDVPSASDAGQQKKLVSNVATGAQSNARNGVQSGMSRKILGILRKQNLGKKAIAQQLGKLHRTRYLNDLVRKMTEAGWIEYTIPDKPNSRLQKYRLTRKGRPLTAAAGLPAGASAPRTSAG